VPVLITVGASISFLGVALINALGLRTWAGWVDIALGLTFVAWGAIWSRHLRPSRDVLSSTNSFEKGTDRRAMNHKDIRHEIITDKEAPYFLGDSVGIKVKLTNLLNQSCTREFFYQIQLPDGMYLSRPLYPVHFGPLEEKVITLGDPVFLHFLGIFRLVIFTGQAEEDLIREGKTSAPVTFQSLFAGYARDREGYQLQTRMVGLTSWIRGLTVVIIVLTAALIVFSLLTWLGDA